MNSEESAINFLRSMEGLPSYWTKIDVCNHFGYPRGLSLAKLFSRRGLVYSSFCKGGTFCVSTPVFIKEVNGSVEMIPSIKKFCEQVLLSPFCSKTVADYVRNQFLIKYNNRLYTAAYTSDFEHFGFYRGFDTNPYNKLKIRQQMREMGLYDGSILTLNEICDWYFIPRARRDRVERVCDILDIPYYYEGNYTGFRENQPCVFRNEDTGEVLAFASLSEAGRRFGYHDKLVKKYFESKSCFHVGNVLYKAFEN